MALTPGENASVSANLRQLEIAIQNQLSGRLHDFHLDWRGDGLVLLGHCRTYHAKQLAQQAVMTATKLPIAANAIEVS
ncbi:MAG: hypothetical protein ACK4RK_02350 [Gemmataceae bacterium]